MHMTLSGKNDNWCEVEGYKNFVPMPPGTVFNEAEYINRAWSRAPAFVYSDEMPGGNDEMASQSSSDSGSDSELGLDEVGDDEVEGEGSDSSQYESEGEAEGIGEVEGEGGEGDDMDIPSEVEDEGSGADMDIPSEEGEKKGDEGEVAMEDLFSEEEDWFHGGGIAKEDTT